MDKDKMITLLESFISRNSFGNNSERHGMQNIAIVSAMNLLSDLKGYKVQYCRKPNRLIREEDKK